MIDPASRPYGLSVREPQDADLAHIPEAVLQDAWARRLYSPTGLKTTTGEPVTVLDPGTLNRGSGPDFSGATLRISTGPDDLLWMGDVEIHRTSAEWNAHRHGTDPAYDRVILHVIISPDRATGTLTRADGTRLPELVLFPHLDQSLRALAHDFYLRGPQSPPNCAARWREVPHGARLAWVRQLGVERLRHRAARLGRAFGHTPNLDQLLIAGVFRALGYAPNADAMERLATRLPLGVVRSLADPQDVHALLVGLAGLTDPRLFSDDLETRYRRLARTHPLPEPMHPAAWRHGGRPANAPRRRIAQAAALLSVTARGPGLLHRDGLDRLRAGLGAPEPLRAMRSLLRELPVLGVGGIGRARTDVILTNAILPILFLDAEMREDLAVESQVLAVLDELPPEDDHVTREFAEAGLRPESALESQGMHRLASAYCEEGRCARCAIGTRLYPALLRVSDTA
ncbi:MAG: DUF2851 family protein [Bacteroidota bacterium]